MKRRLLVGLLFVVCVLCLAFGLAAYWAISGVNPESGNEQSGGNGDKGDNEKEIEYVEGTKGLKYTLNSDGASYSCTGLGTATKTDITIASHFDGLLVTSIGSSAFEGCTSLTSITIPDSVTSIGYDAFYGCTSFTTVTIPDNVTSIGNDAFSGCTSLNAVYITNIASWYNITFGNSISNPLSYAHNLYLNNELVTELEIPNSVTSIGSSAFFNCTSLTSITIPDGVTSIGSYAFRGCISLTSITIPDSVTIIDVSAFSGCTSLTSITIPDSVTIIGESAFFGCTSLTSITIPQSVTSIGSAAFEDTAYYNNPSNWTNNVLYIGKHLIKAKTNISGNYIIYNGTLTISSSAFWGCTSLTSISIPDSVTLINHYAFYGCTSLTSITIPDSVTVISHYAFYGCTRLESIIIPDSVTFIGMSAFYGCTNLNAVYVTDIASWCNIKFYFNASANPLYYAHNLYLNNELVTELEIPDSVTSIGYSAFRGCTSLTNVTIGNGVTSIGTYAFQGCTSLTSITIPNSVTSIGTYAFQGCTSLTRVIFENTDGWEVSSSSEMTNATSISSVDLANPETAATYLRSTYYGYDWKRS